jgi:hypothetical protein
MHTINRTSVQLHKHKFKIYTVIIHGHFCSAAPYMPVRALLQWLLHVTCSVAVTSLFTQSLAHNLNKIKPPASLPAWHRSTDDRTEKRPAMQSCGTLSDQPGKTSHRVAQCDLSLPQSAATTKTLHNICPLEWSPTHKHTHTHMHICASEVTCIHNTHRHHTWALPQCRALHASQSSAAGQPCAASTCTAAAAAAVLR